MTAVVLAIVASAQAWAVNPGLKAFEVIAIDASEQRASSSLRIRAFGREFALDVSGNSELLASMPEAQRNRIASNDLFLKGQVAGAPGSWVRLNRIAGRFSGGFFDGQELYLIDRAGGFTGTRERGVAGDQTIIFRFSDLDSSFVIDHGGVPASAAAELSKSGAAYQQFASHLQEIVSLEGAAMLAMPLTVVTDTQFGNVFGEISASVVAGRTNFIDGLYSSQLGIGIQLFHHEPLSSNGTLTATDASELLSQFGNFMRDGDGSSIPFQGLGHLFTGRDLDGGTAGIAYLGVLCSRFSGYGVDQNIGGETISALVYAHEVGHNFNAPHDGQEGGGQLGACSEETFAGIMSPTVTTSQQEFSPCSLEQMSAAAGGASRLVEV
ncbi:MAG: M12 family metallo-peptidase, partial [Wenzhouxiangellaceae bacterium]